MNKSANFYHDDSPMIKSAQKRSKQALSFKHYEQSQIINRVSKSLKQTNVLISFSKSRANVELKCNPDNNSLAPFCTNNKLTNVNEEANESKSITARTYCIEDDTIPEENHDIDEKEDTRTSICEKSKLKSSIKQNICIMKQCELAVKTKSDIEILYSQFFTQTKCSQELNDDDEVTLFLADDDRSFVISKIDLHELIERTDDISQIEMSLNF